MKSRIGRNLRLPIVAGTAMFMVAALTLGVQSTSQGAPAAPTPGKACKTKGQRLPGGFVCVKKNGKLVWAVTTATTTPTLDPDLKQYPLLERIAAGGLADLDIPGRGRIDIPLPDDEWPGRGASCRTMDPRITVVPR